MGTVQQKMTTGSSLSKYILPYKGRMVNFSKPVMVYRNLTKQCYSIMQDGIVVGHARSLSLRDCKMKVSEAGRVRVTARKQKNVHAFIEGVVSRIVAERMEPLRYNPYTHSSFVDSNGESVSECPKVLLTRSGAFFKRGSTC